MKKIFVGLVFAFLFLLPASKVLAQDPSEAVNQTGSVEQVQSFDDTIAIHTDGSAQVTEKIIYNFGGNEKHGIYRNIPVIFTTSLGKMSTKILNVAVADENGSPYQFTTYSSGNDYDIKIGNPNATVSGVKTYVISYTIRRVINFFNDHDELYWNVTGNEWQVPILSARAHIILPGQVQSADIKVQCFAGPFGSATACQQATAQNGTADFSQQNLETYSGLTVVVGFPKGLVIPPTAWQNFVMLAQDNWIVIIPLLVLLGMFLLWYFKGRDPEVSNVVVAQYEAPDGLSPGEAVELLKFSEPSRGITAEIIQLAVGGYLKINRLDKDYQFIKLKEADGLLKQHQQTLFNGLFSLSGMVVPDQLGVSLPIANPLISALKSFIKKEQPAAKDPNSAMLSDLKNVFYAVLTVAKKQITQSLVSLKYLTSDPQVVKAGFIVLAVMVGFSGFFSSAVFGAVGLISLLVSALIILLFGLAMPRRTLLGAQTAKQVLGLKLYLNVAEKDRIEFHDAPDKTPERFEKLLPYAIALGVEKQWAGQFVGIYTAPPTWYNDNYSTFNTLMLVNSLNHFHSAAGSTFASHPSSSASGGGSGFGGGGFSGGGFGGGGGGSW